MQESSRKRGRTQTRARARAPSPEITTTTNSLSELSSSWSWPDIDPSEKRCPPTSLLYGLDDEIWRAMGPHHVDPTAFNGRMQLAIRQALDQIGLGWVATNNTSYRVAMGGKNGKFAHAKRIHEQNGWKRKAKGEWKELTTMQGKNIEKCPRNPKCAQITVDDLVIKEADVFHGSFDEIDKEQLRKVLDTYGVAMIRGAMSQHSINEFREQCQECPYGTPTLIQNTAANGKAGGNGNKNDKYSYSYYNNVKENLILGKLQDSIIDALMAGNEAEGNIIKRCKKSILLRYAENSENWAHTDGVDWKYQATLMLSDPSRDFSGGEFYVARTGRRTVIPIPTTSTTDGNSGYGDDDDDDDDDDDCGGTTTGDKFKHQGIVRNIVEFQNAGDLVIFEASKQTKYFHGMLKVKRGTNDTCERVAIGLLQKKCTQNKRKKKKK
mmetsp:Transcript_8376/g.12545  ORF Transcript_8376/g.12545 Transcript_8376/m.12545 type:complete len:437 (+) Transcript_8376:52-1362(+)